MDRPFQVKTIVMSDFSMRDRVIVVTGATKGMGLAIASHLLSLGAKVAMVYRSDIKTAEQALDLLGAPTGCVTLIQADVTLPSQRQKIIDQTLSHFQRIDGLVNNAGVAARHKFLTVEESELDEMFAINLKGPILLAQLVAKEMITQNDGGSIVNISSISGHRSTGGIGYDIAKAGLLMATQAMANTLGQYNIRVNSISPGAHKTEMNRYHWENKTDAWKKIENIVALKRGAEAKEIAGTVCYLLSEQSSYTTGIDIPVDGGFLAHCPGRDN